MKIIEGSNIVWTDKQELKEGKVLDESVKIWGKSWLSDTQIIPNNIL